MLKKLISIWILLLISFATPQIIYSTTPAVEMAILEGLTVSNKKCTEAKAYEFNIDLEADDNINGLNSCVSYCLADSDECVAVQYHPSDSECILLHTGFLKECNSLSDREKVEQGHNGYYEIRLARKHITEQDRN